MQTFIVDAFTDRPFGGNPAGVCLVPGAIDPPLMLKIAQELGLSETAFVRQTDRDYRIRFFSPVMEIPLCGHATLAAAKVLFAEHTRDEVRLTNIDELELTARVDGDAITLEFPVYETVPAEVPQALLTALGIDRVENVAYNAETSILLLEIDSPEELAELTPDFQALQASHDGINGVLVTAAATDDDFDFCSRYFWPWSGTNEDPATGGTHTFLTSYWGERLGKTSMRSRQLSKRGGSMKVELRKNKLLITSQACIVFRGELVSL